jgi:hypothetical protein
MKIKTLSAVTAAVLSLAVLTARAEDKLDPSKLPPASTATGVTYDKDIKPLLDNSCIKCHKGEKAKGKLHLDSLAGVLKGGEDAPNIVPGDSGKSTLVYAVSHIGPDEDDFMPPLKNKANIGPLTKTQIGLIRAWIDQGAK